MRILHVTQGYYPARGGTETLVQRLSEEFVRQFGDEVTVFTTNCCSTEGFRRPDVPRLPAGAETINGVRVRRFPVRTTPGRLLRPLQHLAYRYKAPGNQRLRTLHQGPIVPGLREAIVAERADVVAASSFPLRHMFTALDASRATGRPCVFYGGLHPEDDWGSGRPMIYGAIRRAAGYVAYTPYEAEHVAKQGIIGSRVSVIPLGVDLEPFDAGDDVAAREWLGVPRGVPVVGFIGPIGPHKGIDTLLRAMPHLWRERPEVRLLIAGARAPFARAIDDTLAGWPAEAREKVIVRYDFDEADKPRLFRAVDVFVYASGFESFGLAILEAWAAGKPVVSCRRGAIPWVVEPGLDGLLVDYDQESQVAGAVLTLLDNPDWRRQLAEAGHRKIRNELTWDKVARRFRTALEDAVAAGKPPSPPRPLHERLPAVTSIDQFHALLSSHGILDRDERFIHLEIDAANTCNLRCTMCHFSVGESFPAPPAYLPPARFRSIADVVLPRARAVMLSIGSEPLTSPHFVETLELASRYGVPELGFYTNGLLMKERIADAILEHGVTVVAVSVDGATKRTFERIRRGADFDVLMRNIRMLVTRRAALGRSLPKVRFGVVLMRSNIEEIEDLVTLAWRLGAEELNFFHMVAYDGLGMERESLVHHKALSNRCLERALERAKEVGLTVVHAPKPFALEPLAPGGSPSPAAGPFVSTPYCRFPFFHVAINAGGQVLPCPFSNGEAAYGVVSDDMPFERIWLGPRFMELRRRILAGDPPSMCRRCSFLASTYPDVPAFFEPRANTVRPA